MNRLAAAAKAVLERKIAPGLADNEAAIDEVMGNCADLLKRSFLLGGDRRVPGLLVCLDGMADLGTVEAILKELLPFAEGSLKRFPDDSEVEALPNFYLSSASTHTCETVGEAIAAVISGNAVLLFEGYGSGLIANARGWKERNVEEPSTENNLRGPRDGFSESIRTNTALVRRRIRDPMLRFAAMTVGTRTQTSINIAYIGDLVKEGLVDEVKRRLGRIRIDSVLESGYIEELIEDAPLSPFNTAQSTERPDKVASALLEGRVAIFVDNTPHVLIVPTFFWQFMQAPDDYYNRYWVGTFYRFVRYIAFMISLLLPSIYVMLVSFHQEMIPTSLALTIASGREIIPFPVLLEALIMEFAFELMREAGLRMPKPIGQAVSIVGSLIIGQAAVQAGLVSPFMVIVVAMTGISSFAIPGYTSSLAIRLLRFPLLIASGLFGLLGFATMAFALLLHVLSIHSFGEPYLAPASPYRPSDQRDMLLRVPIWMMDLRPEFAQDRERMEGSQMPKAPKEGQR
ncbi:spore germination protein [Cohnella fermenti]|uniref:Spore germination protein n=1 Tax=Cohnella fermenti TaxID=2565925 RepID=A0A4S4BRH0_9BACL|nr:spore germination protein [Cohnella fermenti]THF77547.1 spore germination protein [Cohnella fermenti]